MTPDGGVAAAVARALKPHVGVRTPGGCDHCDAYQTVEQIADVLHIVAVWHDDWCPAHDKGPSA